LGYTLTQRGNRTYLTISTVVCIDTTHSVLESTNSTIIHLSPYNTDSQNFEITNKIIIKSAGDITRASIRKKNHDMNKVRINKHYYTGSIGNRV